MRSTTVPLFLVLLLAGCDPEPRPADSSPCWEDRDGDGWGGDPIEGGCVSTDRPGFAGRGMDCDDSDPLVSPEATTDTPCDGVDSDCDGALEGREGDEDRDGYACDDCDDDRPTVNPGAVEACDGEDTDCDPSTALPLAETDVDGDGVRVCEGDCDDSLAARRPGLPELCDGIDNDCDGQPEPDEVDSDGDGALGCEDCDDQDSTRAPDLWEQCDGVDNDCDGHLPVVEFDSDSDGVFECAGDCDDLHPFVAPGLNELCDGLDNDCDGTLPADEADLDADGAPECLDCDDADPDPSTWSEACDGLDTNCDGSTDGELDLDGDGALDCLLLDRTLDLAGAWRPDIYEDDIRELAASSTVCPEYLWLDSFDGALPDSLADWTETWSGGCSAPDGSAYSGEALAGGYTWSGLWCRELGSWWKGERLVEALAFSDDASALSGVLRESMDHPQCGSDYYASSNLELLTSLLWTRTGPRFEQTSDSLVWIELDREHHEDLSQNDRDGWEEDETITTRLVANGGWADGVVGALGERWRWNTWSTSDWIGDSMGSSGCPTTALQGAASIDPVLGPSQVVAWDDPTCGRCGIWYVDGVPRGRRCL